MNFKEYVTEATLKDNFPIKDSKVTPEALKVLSSIFFRHDGNPRAKNGSWWLFQINAMLNAFMQKPNASDDEHVELANEIIKDSGGKTQKFLITRKNLISNIDYVKRSLHKFGINSSFSNINDAQNIKNKETEDKNNKKADTLKKVFSSLSSEELLTLYKAFEKSSYNWSFSDSKNYELLEKIKRKIFQG